MGAPPGVINLSSSLPHQSHEEPEHSCWLIALDSWTAELAESEVASASNATVRSGSLILGGLANEQRAPVDLPVRYPSDPLQSAVLRPVYLHQRALSERTTMCSLHA